MSLLKETTSGKGFAAFFFIQEKSSKAKKIVIINRDLMNQMLLLVTKHRSHIIQKQLYICRVTVKWCCYRILRLGFHVLQKNSKITQHVELSGQSRRIQRTY